MTKTVAKNESRNLRFQKVKTYFQKPEHIILVIFAIILTVATIVPIFTLLLDTIKVHPGSVDSVLTGKTSEIGRAHV